MSKESRQKREIKEEWEDKTRGLSTPICADESKADRPLSRAAWPYGLTALTRWGIYRADRESFSSPIIPLTYPSRRLN